MNRLYPAEFALPKSFQIHQASLGQPPRLLCPSPSALPVSTCRVSFTKIGGAGSVAFCVALPLLLQQVMATFTQPS